MSRRKHGHGHHGTLSLSMERATGLAKAADITRDHLAALERDTENLYCEFIEFLHRHLKAAPKCKATGVELLINKEEFCKAISDFVDAAKQSVGFMVDSTDAGVFSLK